MNTLLNASGDPMGAAILDYYKNGHASTLVVKSSMFDEIGRASCRERVSPRV